MPKFALPLILKVLSNNEHKNSITNTTMKRFKLIYLMLLMLAFCAISAAANDFMVNGIYYNIDGNNAIVTYAGYYPEHVSDEYRGDVTIPASVTYNGVTYSVTGIGYGAFYECSNLTSVTIPNSVTIIGALAFKECNELTDVTIPNSITTIGNDAFNGCSKLTSFTIPESITKIGTGAFKNCYSLKTLNFNAVSCADYSTNGYEIPFENLNISAINIGNSVERIPAYFAYGLNNLTSITIPNSVIEIGKSAFSNCSSMSEVHIYDIAKWIDINFKSYTSNPLNNAHHLYLNGIEVTELLIPDSVISIGSYAFYNCTGLTNLTIPNSVTSIGRSAFSYCTGLSSINIPNSVNSIGDAAFMGCSGLTNVAIPNSITTIDISTFYNCTGLSNVTIPNTVTKIDGNAFGNCTGLTNVTIPNSVTTIGGGAYYGCSELIGIFIGSSLTSLGKEAFMNDPSIETVTCIATTPPSWDDNAMFTANVYNHAQLHVPSNSERAYKSDPYWGQFLTIIGDANGDNPSDDSDYIKCDTNGDGEVNIADVNKVIDAILSH